MQCTPSWWPPPGLGRWAGGQGRHPQLGALGLLLDALAWLCPSWVHLSCQAQHCPPGLLPGPQLFLELHPGEGGSLPISPGLPYSPSAAPAWLPRVVLHLNSLSRLLILPTPPLPGARLTPKATQAVLEGPGWPQKEARVGGGGVHSPSMSPTPQAPWRSSHCGRPRELQLCSFWVLFFNIYFKDKDEVGEVDLLSSWCTPRTLTVAGTSSLKLRPSPPRECSSPSSQHSGRPLLLSQAH